MTYLKRFRAVALVLFAVPAIAFGQFSTIQELPGQSDDDFGNNGYSLVEAPNGDVLAFVVKNGERTGPCCPPPGEPANLLVYRTSDGGATWAGPETFDTAIENGLQGISIPATAVTANGGILLTYGYINAFGSDFSVSNKVFMSMDNGATWSRLNDKDNQSYHLAASPSGTVFSLDAVTADSGAETLVAHRYEAGSDSWTRLSQVPYGNANACGRYLHAASDTTLVFYSSECFFGYGGSADAFRSVSTDGGQTWTDNELTFTNDSGFGDWGTVVNMPDGTVRAVVSSGTVIVYRDSGDNGETWSEPTNWTAGTEENRDISPACSPSSQGALCAFLGRRGSENQLVHVGVAGESWDPLRGPLPIGPRHSGSWWNSGQNGHGFAIEAGGSAAAPVVVVYWYIFDSAGNPIFFVGSGVPDGNVVDINFVSPVGLRFGEFNPLDNDEMESGGTARFVFEDDSTGTFSYEPSAFSVNEWGHSAIENLSVTKLFGVSSAPREFPGSD